MEGAGAGAGADVDVDKKINGILSIIVQDDGDSFAKRAEMYYQKRPELIQMVEDLHKSYRSLADKYEQLSLRSHVQADDEFIDSSPADKEENIDETNANDDCGADNEKVWNELRLKVSELVDLDEQEQLTNDEISDLQLHHHGHQNKASNTKSNTRKLLKKSQCQLSRILSRLFFGKLMK